MSIKSIDRRSTVSEAPKTQSAKGERMSEYFMPEKGHRTVTRAELLSLLGIIVREHETKWHLPFWVKWGLRLRLWLNGYRVAPPLTTDALSTQTDAETASKGKLHD